MYSFYFQALSVELGLIENFPTAVHHQSRLGAILGIIKYKVHIYNTIQILRPFCQDAMYIYSKY